MDQYRVLITRSAQNDLMDISSYIRDELKEPAIAIKLVEKLKVSIMSLSTFPLRYNLVVDERLSAQGFRKFIIDNYLVFYLVSEKEQTVNVVRILYGKRDWEHLL